MQDIADFLRAHAPFDTLDEETLAAIAQSAEIEFHAARAAILDTAAGPAQHTYVVRRGSVELVIEDRLLDLMGEGEMSMADRISRAFAEAPDRKLVLRRLAQAAVAERPPTGFIRDFVLHSTGERKGVLDIKRRGLLPIESLARWSGLSAGVSAASTRARLRASAEAGTLTREEATNLRDAFDLFAALRMEHQVRQLRDGDEPDNLIKPERLAAIARRSLKEAFRAVACVERRVAADYGLSPR